MAKYLLLYRVILPDSSTYSWSSSLGEGQKILCSILWTSLYIPTVWGSCSYLLINMWI